MGPGRVPYRTDPGLKTGEGNGGWSGAGHPRYGVGLGPDGHARPPPARVDRLPGTGTGKGE